MKIEEVLKLEDGVSGITIEGEIIKIPEEPRNSEYGWSQMIILKDDTDEMSSWINIKSAKDAYAIGQYIKVKGKVRKWTKGNKSGISLNNANVIDEIVKAEEFKEEEKVSQAKQTVEKPISTHSTPVEKEYTKSDYWHDKTLREIENNKCIVRECAIKAVTELACSENKIFQFEIDGYFTFADTIVDYIYDRWGKITSEDITKEFGGTAVEKPEEKDQIEKPKEERIEKAREVVGQIILATEPQLNMVEKIIKSQYITEKEVENIGDLKVLNKENASKYISYWFGGGEVIGERAERELIAKNEGPFKEKITGKEQTIEKKDPKDDSSLVKDLLIETINTQRKELHLTDDEKFEKTIGYNPKLEELTEEKLLKLKELLKDWKPDWMTGK